MSRIVMYARVSSRRQEQDRTIESQIAEIEAYARQRGLSLESQDRYLDEGVSGSRLARPGLDRLRDLVAQDAVDEILCLSPDRLARTLAVQQVLLYEMERHGVKVTFLNQPPMSTSEQEKLWQGITGVIAEYEREVIQDRMRRGRLHRLRQGETVPVQAPYGYRYLADRENRRSQWLVVPDEAAIVEQVFVWYTEQGATVYEIARRLNEQATPSPEGKRWTCATIAHMLRQPAYKGKAYYGRHSADTSQIGQMRKSGRGRLIFPRYTARPFAEWIESSVPAIVDDTLWQAAQSRFDMNSHFSARNSRRPYLLRGLLVCATCGHTLQGRTQGQTVTYRCAYGGNQRPPDVPPHRCVLSAPIAESLVWQQLRTLLDHPQQIQDAWHSLAAVSDAKPDSRRQMRQHHLLLRRRRLLDLYETGILSLSEFQERLTPLERELAELASQLALPAQPPFQISIELFTQRIHAALHSADFATQQEVLRLLIERIVVSDAALSIEHIVPTIDISRLDHTLRLASSMQDEEIYKMINVDVKIISFG